VFVLSVSQSVELCVCSIDKVVSLCYRSVSLSNCGSDIGHVVGLCDRSVILSSCGSVASAKLWVYAIRQSVCRAVGL